MTGLLSSKSPGLPEADPAPTQILIVDDDESNLIAVQAVLSELGHPIVTARSGEEALRCLLHSDFAVILLDVRMPGMDGYETAEVIRGRERSRHVPIIFLSGVDKNEAHLFRGYAAGAVDYVFKPIEPVFLRSKVAVFTDLHEKTQEIRRKAEQEKQLLAENLKIRAQEAEVARALEQSLMQQSLVLEALPIALFVQGLGEKSSREFVGGNVERLTAMSAEQAAEAGRNWLDHVHKDDRSQLDAAIKNARPNTSYDIEYRMRAPDGAYHWRAERGICKTQDGVSQICGVISDVGDRRRLEEQLLHAQKLEAIGQLSGGVAHDFNNMLSVIIGSIDRVCSSPGLDEKTQRRLSLAMQAAQSCADLTKRLLGFARQQSLEPRKLNVAEELKCLGALVDRVLGERIKATIKANGSLPTVHLDSSQFEAAIINLSVNARDAMPDGGTLTITASNRRLGKKEADALDVHPGEYIRLSVVDTGKGMDSATLARATEPFFTTKAPNRGTGLGLSSIYGFLRQSGGGMQIKSTPGKGTTVIMYVPSANSSDMPADTRKGKGKPVKLTGLKVLLVEDNSVVRDVATSMLETLGCKTVAVAGSAEALDTFRTGEFDLLFTDCVMPGNLQGPALAEALRSKQEGLPVLFTSGYRGAGDKLLETGAGFLPKPYTQEQLADAVGRLCRKS